MKKYSACLVICLLANASLAQTTITFDVIFHTVHEASGAFTPALQPTGPGPFNGGAPVPDVELTGQVTLSIVDNGTQLAPAPAVNTITLNGMFTTESGGSPANGWSVHSFDNVVLDLYADNSFVAIDSNSDPRDWPIRAGTAVDGLISDHGPAGQYPGGVCPFMGGCLSANAFGLFPNGTVVFDTGTSSANFPTYADAGNHPLIAGLATQTNPSSGLGFDNGADAIVIDAVLDNLNNLQPYGDGVDGNPGIVRIITTSNTGNTMYMIEGSIVEVPVPVPAAAWLFASGLGALGWMRRRAARPAGSIVAGGARVVARSAVLLLAVLFLAGCFNQGEDPPETNIDNVTPVANAGPNQTVDNQTLVTLDGSGSSDADGDPLSYSWEFTSMPSGSTAMLVDADTDRPEFTPDMIGDYVAELTVDDDFEEGINTDTVTITAEDPGTNPPVANAGPNQNVSYSPPGVTINLDGTGSSDPDMDPLTYSWQIVQFTPASGLPPAQPVILFGDDTATPFFDVAAVDQLGEYRIELTVSDGTLQATDEVLVTVAKGMPTTSVFLGSGLFAVAAISLGRRRRRRHNDDQGGA